MKRLDLSTFIETTMEIKWPDGRLFMIGKPTQKMVVRLMVIQKQINEEDPASVLEMLDEFIYSILSANRNNTKVTKEEIENLSVEMKLLIIQSYAEFVSDIQSNPN